jgi:hypothetical protein
MRPTDGGLLLRVEAVVSGEPARRSLGTTRDCI